MNLNKSILAVTLALMCLGILGHSYGSVLYETINYGNNR